MESGGSSSGTRSVIEFADFRLDPQKRKLSRLDGTPLTLNSRAFDTLLALVERRGEVLSKHQLLDAVWPRAVVEENNLNQAISAIRKTLGDSDSNRIILTVPGRGFCFVAEIRSVTGRNASKGADNPAPQTINSPVIQSPAIESSEWASSPLLDMEARQASQFVSDSANTRRSSPGLLWKRLAVVAFVAFIVVVAGLAAWIKTPEPADAKSIAVLPFANLSDDPEQEYFSDGLTEELINKLSQVDDLVVTGRNSSFYFKGRDDELRDIGQQLGVTHLLQGSVRKAGSRLRITAQLTNVKTNANLWSQNFDSEIADIFSIQDEISAAVTTALSVTLRAGEFSLPGMTGNIDAYDEYLQGYKLFLDATNGSVSNGSGRASLFDAIAHLEKATTIDPDFGIGWVKQDEAYQFGLSNSPPSQTRDFLARQEKAVGKAAALVPEHPKLLQQTARRLINQEQRYADAERLLLPLLDSAVNTNADLSIQYAALLWHVGRPREALPYVQRGRRLEPFQSSGSFVLPLILLTLNRETEALAEIERGLKLEGNAVFLSGAKWAAALQAADKTAALEVSYQFSNFGPSHMAIAEQWRDAGDAAAMAKLQELVAAGDIAEIQYVVYRQWAVALGDPQLGADLLNMQGRAQPEVWLPLYRDLRVLPGFKDYVRKVGLLDYWRTTGNWGDYCRPLEGNGDFECF